MFRSARSSLAGLTVLLSLCGCVNFDPRPDPTRFYVLSGPRTPTASSEASELSVRRAELPEYLDNSKLVVRQSSHELYYHPHHRWSAPLDTMIARALADGLTRARADLNASAGTLDLSAQTLSLRILRFEALPDGEVEVSFEWRLSGTDDNASKRSGRIIQRGEWNGSDYPALVEELSRLLQAAAEELAAELPSF